MNTPDAPFLKSLLPFLKGFTVFYWATGTWWIPMLAILAAWRYIYKRFPLGMYTASTFQMAKAMQLEFLLVVPRVFLWIAIAAWLTTFLGLCRKGIRYAWRG